MLDITVSNRIEVFYFISDINKENFGIKKIDLALVSIFSNNIDGLVLKLLLQAPNTHYYNVVILILTATGEKCDSEVVI